MLQLRKQKAAPRKARAVISVAAALLGAAILCQPDLVHAAPHGGGGFHSGGFHTGGLGGFHGGFHESHWYHGWHNGNYGWWWGADYPDYSYYDYSQPYAGQTWYYCSDPAGYYPYVTQCDTGWQAVPAS